MYNLAIVGDVLDTDILVTASQTQVYKVTNAALEAALVHICNTRILLLAVDQVKLRTAGLSTARVRCNCEKSAGLHGNSALDIH